MPGIDIQCTQKVDYHPYSYGTGGLLSASSQFQDEIANGLMVDDDYGVDIGAAFSLDSDEAVIVPEIELNLPELEYIQNLCKPEIIMAWISTYKLKNTLVPFSDTFNVMSVTVVTSPLYFVNQNFSAEKVHCMN